MVLRIIFILFMSSLNVMTNRCEDFTCIVCICHQSSSLSIIFSIFGVIKFRFSPLKSPTSFANAKFQGLMNRSIIFVCIKVSSDRKFKFSMGMKRFIVKSRRQIWTSLIQSRSFQFFRIVFFCEAKFSSRAYPPPVTPKN